MYIYILKVKKFRTPNSRSKNVCLHDIQMCQCLHLAESSLNSRGPWLCHQSDVVCFLFCCCFRRWWGVQKLMGVYCHLAGNLAFGEKIRTFKVFILPR